MQKSVIRAVCKRHPAILGLVLVQWVLIAVAETVRPSVPLDEPTDGMPRAMTAVDVLSVESIRSFSPSPRGDQLAYVVESADWEKNERVTHLWLTATQTGAGPETQVTHSFDSVRDPFWSADGTRIAFIGEAVDGKHRQIHVLDKGFGEARPATDHDAHVSAARWSPDGSRLYFLSLEPESDELKARKRDKDDILPFETQERMLRLWYVDLSDTTAMPIDTGPGYVRAYDLSDDGRLVLYSRKPSATIDDSHAGELHVLNLESGNAYQLTNNGHEESRPRLSPDGRFALFLARVNAVGDNYYERNLFVVDLTDGSTRELASDFDADIREAEWTTDGKGIFFLGNTGVRSGLYHVEVVNDNVDRVTNVEGTVSSWQFDQRNDRHFVKLTTADSPGDVWHLNVDEGTAERITNRFTPLAKKYRLPMQRIITWRSDDGEMIEGVLTLPLDYEEDKPYPLVTQIHGGPRLSTQIGLFAWRDYIPLLAAKGYMVLAPNHRGSAGYGDAFLRDMVGNYFNNSHKDVVAGIDHLVEQGLADPEKLVVMGWSAGGHMTNRLITLTDRFAAASSGAGAVEWMSMYGTTDARYNRTAWFGGTPWQENAPTKNYVDQSPLRDLWRVSTPTIIFVGQRDKRVPPSQSMMLYRGIKDSGTATELYIAPREGHGFRELRHRLFKINAELEWFERHAMERDYVFEPAPADQGREAMLTSVDGGRR